MRILTLKLANKFRRLAKSKGVSRIARSARGFMAAYARAHGRLDKLSPKWKAKRHAFIKRHYAQVKKRHETLFDKHGSPTRRHLALIMWAASPAPAKLEKLVKHRKVGSKYAYYVKRDTSSRGLDKHSFRTIRIGKHGKLMRVGCPRGHWNHRTHRCRVGMKGFDLLVPHKR